MVYNVEFYRFKERVKELEEKVERLEKEIHLLKYGHDPKSVNPYDLKRRRKLK